MLRHGLMKDKWLRAGLHSNGGGLEQGEHSFQAFTDAKKLLLKNGKTKAASLLWKAVSGGAPIGERLELNTRCRACGAEETAWHRYYGCTALAAPADDDFAKTWLERAEWLKQAAKKDSCVPECLWYRGLAPRNWSTGMCDPRQDVGVHLQGGEVTGRHFYTDGSGGKKSYLPSYAKRVGAAAVQIGLGPKAISLA